MITEEQRIYEQALFLISNTVETSTGRLICFYQQKLLIAQTPKQMHQLLDCIWN